TSSDECYARCCRLVPSSNAAAFRRPRKHGSSPGGRNCVRKPTFVLSDIVGRTFAFISLSITGLDRRHGRLACLVALSGQAPKPHSGAPKARGLTANARTELSFLWPRCAL